MRSAVSAQERASLRASIDAANQRKAELGERLSAQEKLLDKGLVTSDTVAGTRQQLRASESAMAEMRAQMSRTSADSFSAKRYNEASLQGDELRIQEIERQLKLLDGRLAQSAAVVSTHAGRVVEVRVSVGDVLASGAPIASLERTGEAGGLEAVLYLDSRVGKRVKPGMEVQLSPTSVPREKHGVLVATVRSIEDFPSTRRGMMRVLRNEQLVETFLTETAGAPIAVRAELRADPNTPTRYRWSSGKGPTTELSSGTRCGAEITTRSERPIALVLPMFESEG
jgi:HlyD family secretion protein